MGKLPYALQLYSVRDHLEQDPAGTLFKVKAAGYDYVEMAGLCGLSAQEFKAALDAAKLTAVSMHTGYERFAGDVEDVLEEARVFGLEYVVAPWVGGPEYSDRAAWLGVAKVLEEAGARLRTAGVRLCYHNHAHEFERLGGEYIFDLLYDNTAPEHLAVELDTCWARVGGADPVALIRKYQGRMPLLHVKDYVPGNPPRFTEAGKGCMDWDAIFKAARQAGVAWYVVEQDDNFTVDSLESVRISAAFMENWGV